MERGNRSIKHWPEGDRPREKLVRLGASALSDAELLAILLRTGARGVTALDRARQLLTGVRALRELARMTASDLRSCGFGTVHAATIVAASSRRTPAP